MKTKDDPRSLLTEDLNIKETQPKVISKLANNLLITKHHGNGSKHSDIDQPLESTQREDIRYQSYTTFL